MKKLQIVFIYSNKLKNTLQFEGIRKIFRKSLKQSKMFSENAELIFFCKFSRINLNNLSKLIK